LRVYFEPTNQNFYSQPISIREKEWHYFEVYWFENNTNSRIKAWYDGNLKIDEMVDSQGEGKSVDEYRFGGVAVGGGGIPDLFVDCVAISNEYIGEECYPDSEPYFVFNLKNSNFFAKTEFPLEESKFFCNGILCLKFDEGFGNKAYDSSLFHNDGILGNGTVGTKPIWKSGNDCMYGNCLEFDGTPYEIADVVNVTDIPNGSLTIMAWIYPKQILGDERAIVSKWSHGNSGNEWIFRLSNSSTSQLQFYIINTTNGWEEADSTNANIQKNNWYHVAVTYNRETGQVEFYRNGIRLTTNRLIGQTRDGSQIVRIGSQGGGSLDPFNGTIDEVRIWNKILTQQEIQEEMNKG